MIIMKAPTKTKHFFPELLIRLLAIWLFIDCIFPIIESFGHYKYFKKLFWLYILIAVIIITVAILIAVFSKCIAEVIWRDEQSNEMAITGIELTDITIKLIAILGFIFVVKALSGIGLNLQRLLVISPEMYSQKIYYPPNEISLHHIDNLISQCILLGFGILLFVIPRKLINIRNNINFIFTRKN